ncbi:YybS family protein [Psychrobacillus sp. NPDC058041]|uniref:YybS family protein n=1 Tax=Psychrobacillus sp. NPDC058041 TaxID=3346310 RepID=UPI0036DC5CAB
MLKNQTSYLTYGAMMIALFSILLAMSVYVPFVGFITSFIVPLPIAWYSAKFERKQAAWVTIIAIVISFIIGGVFGFLFALIVAPLGFIIGASIRSKKTKLYMLMASGIYLLLMTALQYVISISVLNINVLEQLLGAAEISYEQVGNIMSSVGQLPKDYDSLVEQSLLIAKMTMPAYFIGTVFITAFIYLVINLALLKRLKLEVPKFSQFTDFRLPKAVLWYYLIVSIFSLFVSYEVGSFGYLATINALVILRVLLFLQGVSLIHYYFHVLGYPKWLAVVVTILAIPLYTFTIVLGVFDLLFKLRSYLKGRYKK